MSRKVSTIIVASPGPTTLPPIANIFALLCSLVAFAEKTSWQSAHLMPFTLFAVMEMPIPVPQIRIPLSASPPATAKATFLANSG